MQAFQLVLAVVKAFLVVLFSVHVPGLLDPGALFRQVLGCFWFYLGRSGVELEEECLGMRGSCMVKAAFKRVFAVSEACCEVRSNLKLPTDSSESNMKSGRGPRCQPNDRMAVS